MGQRPVERDPDRGETMLQKLDRNWTDLLQELRVLQTGIQILTGFLLTLPFQQRFAGLNRIQIGLYLALVVLSVLVTALLMSTVVMHRTFFQQRIKRALVNNSDMLLRWTLVLVGLILVGTIGLIFDIVLSGAAGAVAALAVGMVVALLWLVLPQVLRRRALRARTAKGGRR
ncbi:MULTISPECIES: DUF6328 family protein [unclassified Arthrobacter]|uniref:DUF6328 family protein n=1 Tax=unclassified Arthrobacter TaxID=235627 RepID=UPI001E3F5046|nr:MULTISPECIES: DUF6328 family protein [unclassified Arthrobacter]MCC9176168.1 DUF6328 family protein [Arthrobacter sp. zg-Y750]MDK1327141.1 DUF6328 family protein [Arthrobacter sp. zg-Y1143]